jgi:hypothetical protein
MEFVLLKMSLNLDGIMEAMSMVLKDSVVEELMLDLVELGARYTSNDEVVTMLADSTTGIAASTTSPHDMSDSGDASTSSPPKLISCTLLPS